MYRIIYLFVTFITKLHNKLLAINDNTGLALSDKQLHFLIIGFLGFGLIFVIQPIFKWLVTHDLDLFVTFIYVFTLIVVISFAIEIGQAWSGTGDMDFYDIASGILGFLVFSSLYLILYLIVRQIRKIFS